MKLAEALAISRIGFAEARNALGKVIGRAEGPPPYLGERKTRKRSCLVQLLGREEKVFSHREPKLRLESLNRERQQQVALLDWQPIDPVHPLAALARMAEPSPRKQSRREEPKVRRPAPGHSAPQAAITCASPPEALDVSR